MKRRSLATEDSYLGSEPQAGTDKREETSASQPRHVHLLYLSHLHVAAIDGNLRFQRFGTRRPTVVAFVATAFGVVAVVVVVLLLPRGLRPPPRQVREWPTGRSSRRAVCCSFPVYCCDCCCCCGGGKSQTRARFGGGLT